MAENWKKKPDLFEKDLILRDHRDWYRWFKNMQDTAELVNIWKFIDPNTTDQCLFLSEPKIPELVISRIQAVGANTSIFSVLELPRLPYHEAKLETSPPDHFFWNFDDCMFSYLYAGLYQDEMEDLRSGLISYTFDHRRYQLQRRALREVIPGIFETITPSLTNYISDCDTAREMLYRLQRQFRPTDRQIAGDFRWLCKCPVPEKLERIKIWSKRWESFYNDYVKFDPSVVDDEILSTGFVRAISGGRHTQHNFLFPRKLSDPQTPGYINEIIHDYLRTIESLKVKTPSRTRKVVRPAVKNRRTMLGRPAPVSRSSMIYKIRRSGGRY